MLQLSIFLAQIADPFEVGVRDIHQASQGLSDPLYRVDHQGNAF